MSILSPKKGFVLNQSTKLRIACICYRFFVYLRTFWYKHHSSTDKAFFTEEVFTASFYLHLEIDQFFLKGRIPFVIVFLFHHNRQGSQRNHSGLEEDHCAGLVQRSQRVLYLSHIVTVFDSP